MTSDVQSACVLATQDDYCFCKAVFGVQGFDAQVRRSAGAAAAATERAYVAAAAHARRPHPPSSLPPFRCDCAFCGLDLSA